MIWFTADLHLGHANIIKLASRPFSSVKAMERQLIVNINNRVSYTDELWILGDFAVRAKAGRVRELREQIVCRHVHLIHGNHDPHMTPEQTEGVFEHDTGYCDRLCSPAGRRLVLCHYPIADWNGQRRGSYMLHGHIHSRGSAYNERQRADGMLRYDVGVDANGYAPVSAEQIDAWFADTEPRALHHADKTTDP